MNPVTPLNPQDNAEGFVTAVLEIEYMWDVYCEYQVLARHVCGFKEFNPTFAQFLRSIQPFEWGDYKHLGWWVYHRWRLFTLRKRWFKTITERKLLPALLMEGSIVSLVAQFI